MNQFLLSAKQLINLHGESCTYISVTTGTYDPNTGSVINSESSTSIKAYRKDLKATQYNYPSLIGKHALLVYISSDSLVVVPSCNDKLSFAGETYTAEAVQSHRANGEVVLYRIACYK